MSSSIHRQPCSSAATDDADVADQTISEILASDSDDANGSSPFEAVANAEEHEIGNVTDPSQSYTDPSGSVLSGGLMSPAPTPNAGPRSVFDRLISPSNYTGTHKTLHAISTKKRHNDKASLQVDAPMEDDLTSLQIASTSIQSPTFAATSNTSSSSREGDDAAVATDPSTAASVAEAVESASTAGHIESDERGDGSEQNAQNRERNSDYTQQNVFERLTKTVTASYAVKHQAEG